MKTGRHVGRVGVFVLAACGGGLLTGVAAAQGRAVAAAAAPAAAVESSPAAVPAAGAEYGALLGRYCVTCHNGRLRTAGLSLDDVEVSEAHVAADAELWEKVVQKLRSRTMPPPRRPRPDDDTYTAFATWLETSLDRAADAAPNPGRPQLHRMNRAEYRNAVRDLLAVDADVSALPADDSTFGFDNIADALGVSPLLLESYVTTARKIARLAVGSPVIPTVTTTYKTPEDLTQDYHLRDLPLGTRGGIRVSEYFPVDAEYEIRVRLRRTAIGTIRGIGEEHHLELTLDGERIGLFPIGSEDAYTALVVNEQNPGQTVSRAFTADEGMRVRLPVPAGRHEIIAAFVGKPAALSEETRKPFIRSYVASNSRRGLPDVDSVLIAGPFDPQRPDDTPSRQRIFTCRPASGDAAPCARSILSRLGRQAYRRPLETPEIDRLLAFYEEGSRDGGFESGIELALRFLLASPQFIFRLETEPADVAAGAVYPVSDLDLASRLSYFLWSSIPDDELLAVAERGELSAPDELQRQVRRMLADPRASALVENFAGQWLYLRNLANTHPDPPTFPDFDDNLRRALQRETELFFESVMAEGPQHPRPADRRLHVHQRAAGAPLRHPRHLRRPLPPGGGHGRRAPGHPGPRQPADGDVVRHPHVAGAAGQVDSREPPRVSAASAAARRAGPRGRGQRRGSVDPGAAGAAPGQPGLRRLPCPDGSLRLRPGELRRHRPLAQQHRRRDHRRIGRAAGRHGVQRAERAPGGHPAAARFVPGDVHAQAAHVRRRTRHGVLRRAGRPPHRARGGRGRLSVLGNRRRRRDERRVPEEGEAAGGRRAGRGCGGRAVSAPVTPGR